MKHTPSLSKSRSLEFMNSGARVLCGHWMGKAFIIFIMYKNLMNEIEHIIHPIYFNKIGLKSNPHNVLQTLGNYWYF